MYIYSIKPVTLILNVGTTVDYYWNCSRETGIVLGICPGNVYEVQIGNRIQKIHIFNLKTTQT